jgi:hypothetical protein
MKKEYIILILVIVGLGAYLSLRSTDRTHYELPALARLESAKIDRMLITTGDSTIELVKKDADWFLEPQGYRADSIKVTNMVNAAAGLKITALVSEAASYQRYDLNDEAKINVRIFQGGQKQREFDLGKSAPTYQHTFARLADNPNVYHAQGTLKNTFDQSIDDLRDKTVLSVDRDAVTTISLHKGDRTLTAAKKEIPANTEAQNEEKESADSKTTPPPPPEVQWQDDQGQTVDKTIVERMLTTMAKLQCEAYLDDAAKEKLQDPVWTLTLTTASGNTILSVYAPSEKDAYQIPASSSASQYAFQLSKSKVETMEKDLNKLLGIEAKPEAAN